MNIHIVHLPQTFPYLLKLSLAFNKYGFSQVTLVANGFDQEQFEQLKILTSPYEFVSLLDIPTKRILSHGQALNYAFSVSTDENFCFADHDIFPTQPLSEIINNSMQYNDVICFGYRPENTTVDYKGFAASAMSTQSGVPLATSFFSIYKRSITQHAMAQHKIGFEQYFRRSQMPGIWGEHPDIIDLKEPFLVDTCKLLSLVMNDMGASVEHFNAEYVCHLGGLCGAINRFINNGMKVTNTFEVTNIPSENELHEFYKTHQKRHPKVMEIKRAISDYCFQLLNSHQKNQERPRFKVKNVIIKKAVEDIDRETALLFKTV